MLVRDLVWLRTPHGTYKLTAPLIDPVTGELARVFHWRSNLYEMRYYGKGGRLRRVMPLDLLDVACHIATLEPYNDATTKAS
jgi:hypothetical protein